MSIQCQNHLYRTFPDPQGYTGFRCQQNAELVLRTHKHDSVEYLCVRCLDERVKDQKNEYNRRMLFQRCTIEELP